MGEKLNAQTPAPSFPTRRLVGVGAGVVLVLGILLTIWWVASGGGGFSPRTVDDMLAVNPELNPTEATSELCGEPACVEGWRTDLGSYLRFNSTGEAEYWATLLGDDGRRFETVVLDMRGEDLDFQQRRKAIDILFAAHDWF